MKPEPNPYLPRVNSQRLLNLLDVGHNAPATGIVTKPVRMGVAGDFRFPDADRDGVPDLFDCAPLDPTADGWWGDAYKRAKSYFKVDYAAAASRRASVRQAVSGGARAASSYGRRAASYVRRVPTRPTQVISRHVARHITRAAAPTIKRIASRPSPEQLKRVTAAAFPKTAAMITGAAELRKVVGAMRPPSGADLAQVARTAIPSAITLPTIMGVAAAAETSQRQQEQRAQPKGMWETTLLTLKPITEPLGIYSAPVEKREYRKEVGEYETAHKKAQDMTAAHEAMWGGMTEGTAEQVAEAEKSIAAIEAQKLVAEGEYSDVERSFEKYEAERGEYAWAGLDRAVSGKIPTLYDISDAGAPFREKHKKQIDVVRGAYIKYSPDVAKDVIYPYAGGFAVGQYEQLQKYPVSFALTTAAFAAVPPVFKGLGGAAKAVGLGSKVARIPVVGGAIQKHGLKVGIAGITGLWGASVGMRVHAAPTWEEKGRVSGKIMASEVLPLAVAAGVPGMLAPATPVRIRTPGYTGYGIKGFKKTVTTTREVPALQRGGVYEADLLRKPPTTTKDVITGYVREPIPIVGIKRAKFTTEGATEGIAEVTTTWKGLQFGRRWTPAEITKIKTVEGLKPTSAGVRLQMAEKTVARVGQFRYTKEAAAVGRVKGGYFLPEGEGVLRLTTAEKGLVPTRDPLLMITEGVPTPTRVYGEYMHPYMKTGDIPLYGSPARMQWIEVGTHKISYGVRGGIEQPKLELGGWGKPPAPRGMKSAGAGGIPPTDVPISTHALSTIPPTARIPQWGERPLNRIKLRNELIELEAHPPRSSALFGTKAEKAAWVRYNKKVTNLKSKIKELEAKEKSDVAATERAEAKKWGKAEVEYAEQTGRPVEPPRGGISGQRSERQTLIYNLIELEAHPPRSSALYGTKAEKAAWVKYNKKVTNLKSEIKKLEAKEKSDVAATERAEAKKWGKAEVEYAEQTGRPVEPPRGGISGQRSERQTLIYNLIELEAHPPRSSALYGTKAEKAAWVKYNKKVTNLKSEIKKLEAKEKSDVAATERAEAKKWGKAEVEYAEQTGRPVEPPRGGISGQRSERQTLIYNLIELEAHPPRSSALYGTKAEKAAWVKYNKKVTNLKSEIKKLEAKEKSDVAATERAEAKKWGKAEVEYAEQTGRPVEPPRGGISGQRSERQTLIYNLIELEAHPPRSSALYGTKAEKAAWVKYNKKVTNLKSEIKKLEAKEKSDVAATERAEAKKWGKAEVEYAEQTGRPVEPPRGGISGQRSERQTLIYNLIELEAHPPRSSALYGTKAEKAAWVKYNKKVTNLKSEIKKLEAKEKLEEAKANKAAEAQATIDEMFPRGRPLGVTYKQPRAAKKKKGDVFGEAVKKAKAWKPKEVKPPEGYIAVEKPVGREGLVQIQLQKVKTEQKQQQKIKSEQIQRANQLQKQMQMQLQALLQTTPQAQKAKTAQAQKLKQKVKTAQAQKLKLKQMQILEQLEIPKTAQKLKQMQMLEQKQMQKQKVKTAQKLKIAQKPKLKQMQMLGQLVMAKTAQKLKLEPMQMLEQLVAVKEMGGLKQAQKLAQKQKLAPMQMIAVKPLEIVAQKQIIVPEPLHRIPPPPPPVPEWVPPPPIPKWTPPPTFTPLIGGDGGMAGGGGLRGKGRRAWDIENPLITLDEFFASPPQPKKPVKPVGMTPMVPAGVV